MKRSYRLLGLLAITASSLIACDSRSVGNEAARHTPETLVKVTPPEWARDAVMYQINIRQFTKEGTLVAAEAQLPRLKALGVDILWLMPIHRSEKKIGRGRSAVPTPFVIIVP